MKNKKLVLDNAALEEEFFEDVKLIGIVCPIEAYHFIWIINQMTNYNFIRNHSAEVQVNDVFYPVYSFQEDDKFLEHYIFSNRSKTNYLLNDMKNIDFIFMSKGNIFHQEDVKQQNEILKQIHGVVYTFDLDSSRLNQRQHLIL
jgi:hypothetical protein